MGGVGRIGLATLQDGRMNFRFAVFPGTNSVMSTGAVFKLLANAGKCDGMLVATEVLNDRIKAVMCARRRAGKADITPTLTDIERTHVLFVNAHYKPFAAIGYEYNKVRPQSGCPTLGSGVTFSIPQYGDFFHDMVVRTRISAANAATQTTPLQGSRTAFPLNTATDFYNLVDATGHMLVPGVEGQPSLTVPFRNLVRYCEYPGNRLFRNTKFDVNGNPLDEYCATAMVMMEKFTVPVGKRSGYNRLVGQQVPRKGYSGPRIASVSDADSANTPAGIFLPDGLFDGGIIGGLSDNLALNVNPPLPANPDPALVPVAHWQGDYNEEEKTILDGPQTPKPVQPALDIWSKLRFWFNDDVRLSIPSVSIPFGQRFITLELAEQDDLIFEFCNLYVEHIHDTANIETVLDTSAVPQPVQVLGAPTGDRVKTYTPLFIPSSIEGGTIGCIETYINNIFVNPEVHDIYIKRIGFSLIRVYRHHYQRVNESGSSEKLLSQLKWPVEYIFVGLRPAYNESDTNLNEWRDWHRMTRVVDATNPVACAVELPAATAGGGGLLKINAVIPDTYPLEVPTVETLSMTSHGIQIFDHFDSTFYNAYLPFHYGGAALNTPDDPGALFVNFSLFPRSYQPSGHLNISRARETYLRYHTHYIDSNTPADMHAVALAINFLLVTDGSAVLRYST